MIAPNEEMTESLMVTSDPIPVDVMPTVPLPPALMGPVLVTVTDPALATTLILPAAFVVIPVGDVPAPTVILPVVAV